MRPGSQPSACAAKATVALDFIEFADAVGNPLRGKCCAYLFD